MDGFLTIFGVQNLLRCSEKHVRNLIADGRLPATKIGRKWLVTPQAVSDYVIAHGKTNNPNKKDGE